MNAFEAVLIETTRFSQGTAPTGKHIDGHCDCTTCRKFKLWTSATTKHVPNQSQMCAKVHGQSDAAPGCAARMSATPDKPATTNTSIALRCEATHANRMAMGLCDPSHLEAEWVANGALYLRLQKPHCDARAAGKPLGAPLQLPSAPLQHLKPMWLRSHPCSAATESPNCTSRRYQAATNPPPPKRACFTGKRIDGHCGNALQAQFVDQCGNQARFPISHKCVQKFMARAMRRLDVQPARQPNRTNLPHQATIML